MDATIIIITITNLFLKLVGFSFGTPGAANVIRVILAAGPFYWDASL